MVATNLMISFCQRGVQLVGRYFCPKPLTKSNQTKPLQPLLFTLYTSFWRGSYQPTNHALGRTQGQTSQVLYSRSKRHRLFLSFTVSYSRVYVFPFPSRRHPVPLLLSSFLTPGTMWMAPLRKSSPSIRRVLIAPSLFNKSDGSSRPLRYYGGSSYDEDKGPDSLFKMLVRWLSSGVLIVGPSLGICYCSSSDATSLFSFADCSNVAASATQDHGLRHSDSPDSIPVKKPKYLFGGTFLFLVSFN